MSNHNSNRRTVQAQANWAAAEAEYQRRLAKRDETRSELDRLEGFHDEVIASPGTRAWRHCQRQRRRASR